MVRCVVMTGLALIIGAGAFSMAAAEPVPGLRVGSDGTILKDGMPYRGVGVNYMDVFSRCLKDPDDTSYREGFAILAEHGIPFVRFNAGGFYPVEWALYQSDPDRYFSLMDGVVEAAEEHGIGLIPSLFWWSACIPDLVGEPRNQWGNPDSKTHAFMRRYTRKLVSRYRDSAAIWAWEFGNEYNLAVDLPNAAERRPWTHVHKGSPPERGPADDLDSEMVRTALRVFGETVRAIDPDRPITSGHSLPRPSAHHQRVEGSWTRDSRAEFRDNLIYMTPAPLDLVSVHVYPHAREKRFGQERVPYAEIFQEAIRGAREANKGLFVGEFGPPHDNEAPWTPDTAREEGERLVEALLESPVQLAAFWVFDFAWQEASMSVTPTNHRKGYLKILDAANKKLAGR